MKLLAIIMSALIWYTWAPDVEGDIYVWEDEDGGMSFSNYSPPQKAKVFLEETEKPADEASQEVELAQLEKKLIQGQKDIEEKLAQTNQNLVLVIEKTEALVEDLEERVEEADRRASEAASYARGMAEGLSMAAAERAAPPPATVYVERNGTYYPNGFGFVGHHGFHGRTIHSGFHAKKFFHKAHPGIIGKKSILRDIDSAHRPQFRFSSTTSISPPRHDSFRKAPSGKRHFRR
jgi:hypothetical protein